MCLAPSLNSARSTPATNRRTYLELALGLVAGQKQGELEGDGGDEGDSGGGEGDRGGGDGKGGDGEDGEYEGGSPKAEWGSSSRREVVEIVVVVVRVRVV